MTDGGRPYKLLRTDGGRRRKMLRADTGRAYKVLRADLEHAYKMFRANPGAPYKVVRADHTNKREANVPHAGPRVQAPVSFSQSNFFGDSGRCKFGCE